MRHALSAAIFLYCFATPSFGQTPGDVVANVVNAAEALLGQHAVRWYSRSLNSGVYLYRLRFGDQTLARKLVLLR